MPIRNVDRLGLFQQQAKCKKGERRILLSVPRRETGFYDISFRRGKGENGSGNGVIFNGLMSLTIKKKKEGAKRHISRKGCRFFNDPRGGPNGKGKKGLTTGEKSKNND